MNPDFAAPYYRLRQTDYDGTTKTFGPLHVKFSKVKEGFSVKEFGPNPFSDRITFNYSAGEEAINYSLMSQTGAILRQGKIESGSGSDFISLDDLSDLPSGIYYMVFICNEDKKLIKLLKS